MSIINPTESIIFDSADDVFRHGIFNGFELLDNDHKFLETVDGFLRGKCKETVISLTLLTPLDPPNNKILWDYILTFTIGQRKVTDSHSKFIVRGFDNVNFDIKSVVDPRSHHFCIEIVIQKFKPQKEAFLQSIMMGSLPRVGAASPLQTIPVDIIRDQIISQFKLGHVYSKEHTTMNKITMIRMLEQMYNEERGRMDRAFQEVIDNFRDPDYLFDCNKKLHFILPQNEDNLADARSFFRFITRSLAKDSRVRVQVGVESPNKYVVHLLNRFPTQTHVIFDVDFNSTTEIVVSGIGFEYTDAGNPLFQPRQMSNLFRDTDSLRYFIRRLKWLKETVANAR